MYVMRRLLMSLSLQALLLSLLTSTEGVVLRGNQTTIETRKLPADFTPPDWFDSSQEQYILVLYRTRICPFCEKFFEQVEGCQLLRTDNQCRARSVAHPAGNFIKSEVSSDGKQVHITTGVNEECQCTDYQQHPDTFDVLDVNVGTIPTNTHECLQGCKAGERVIKGKWCTGDSCSFAEKRFHKFVMEQCPNLSGMKPAVEVCNYVSFGLKSKKLINQTVNGSIHN